MGRTSVAGRELRGGHVLQDDGLTGDESVGAGRHDAQRAVERPPDVGAARFDVQDLELEPLGHVRPRAVRRREDRERCAKHAAQARRWRTFWKDKLPARQRGALDGDGGDVFADGARVEPGEVQSVLAELDAVEACAVSVRKLNSGCQGMPLTLRLPIGARAQA